MFRSFFTTIFRGSSTVLCAVTVPPADLRSLSSYYYAVCGRMYISSVIQQFLRIISTTAQSTVEDPLKMVVKKDRNM